MAINVYPIPSGIVQSITYSPQHVTAIETGFWGEPSQITQVTPRVKATVQGVVYGTNHAAFANWIERMAGGEAATAFPDMPMRRRQGWDAQAAINSSGTEYWRESGETAAFPGGTPTSPWRTANVQANGALAEDATTITLDGLLANETVKAGTPLRVGTGWRYVTLTAATANASGEISLTISCGLRAAVADNAAVTLPGDLAVFRLHSMPKIGSANTIGMASWEAEFRELYASEITGGLVWVVD